MAIIGLHALVYSKKATAVRRLFRHGLGWRAVDAGGGWLIFAAPPAELAVHPAKTDSHELYLMCDNIAATLASLERKGIKAVAPVADRGWGLVTALRLPGGETLGLYEPRHKTAIAKRRQRSPAASKRPRRSIQS